jgi:RNA polymerase sigma-70 factor (ECF subfamily)
MPTREDLSQSEDRLVLRARNGDREAFGELVRRHQRRVWLVCRQYLEPEDADNASQDVFVKAFTGLASFDGRAALTTWLTRIAINTCLDVLRGRRREGVVASSSDGGDGEDVLGRIPDDRVCPETRAMQRDAVSRLAECERALPERQREIFRLRFFAEMELEQIAEALGVHVGTVKTQLHRAVRRLRDELGDAR